MKLADFNRLKKIMSLSQSQNDHEALASLKAGNAILAKYGYTWARVFDRLITVENELEEAPPGNLNDRSNPAADSEVEEAFIILYETVPPSSNFIEFVDNMYEIWQRTHRLSRAQRDAIVKSAARNRRHGT